MYTSEQFQRLMVDHGVVCSMSRSGNVWDTAIVRELAGFMWAVGREVQPAKT
jgi:transposase InsO family protein